MRLVVPLESAARDEVENPVGALAILGRVTAALDFEVVDIARIELRTDVGSDVRIRNGHAVDQPVDLMSAGVRWTSRRLTMVCVVDERGSIGVALAVTLTSALAVPSAATSRASA